MAIETPICRMFLKFNRDLWLIFCIKNPPWGFEGRRKDFKVRRLLGNSLGFSRETQNPWIFRRFHKWKYPKVVGLWKIPYLRKPPYCRILMIKYMDWYRKNDRDNKRSMSIINIFLGGGGLPWCTPLEMLSTTMIGWWICYFWVCHIDGYTTN